MNILSQDSPLQSTSFDNLLRKSLLLLNRHPQLAWSIAQRAQEKAAQLDDATKLAQADQLIGMCLLALGQFEAARNKFAHAIEAFEQLENAVYAACCRRDMGIAAYYMGNYEAAKTAFDTSLIVLQVYDQPLDTSRCLRWMAIMSNFRHEVILAHTYLATANDLIIGLDAPSDAADCLFIKGMIAARQSNYHDAIQAFSESAKQFILLDEEVSLGRVYHEHAYVLLALEQFESARAVAGKALALFQRHKLAHRIAMVNELLAVIAMSVNEFHIAYSLIEEAILSYQSVGMEVFSLQALLHRANLDYYLEAWREATGTYEEILIRCRAIGVRHLTLLAESNLGLIAMKEGQYDLALAHTLAALDEAQQLERIDDMARCHRQLASIYSFLEQPAQIQHHYIKAIELLQTIEAPLSSARLQLEYAKMCQQIGAYVEAQQALEGARAVFVQYGTSVFMADCDLQHAQLALHIGDLVKVETLVAACKAVYSNQQLNLPLAKTLHIEGDLHAARGDIASAIQLYQTAFAVLEAFNPGDAAIITESLARLLLRNGDAQMALTWLRKGIRLSQQTRVLTPTEYIAAQVAHQFSSLLYTGLEVALYLDEPVIALTFAENTRAQVTLAWLENQRRGHRSNVVTRTLSNRLLLLRTKLETTQTMISPNSDAYPTFLQLQAEYDEALALWRRFGSGIVPGRPQGFDWDACVNTLSTLPSWQALVYWLDQDCLIIWHCTPNGVHSWKRQLTPVEQRSLALCSNPDPATRSYLYDRDPETVFTSSPGAYHLASVAEMLLPPEIVPTLHPDQLLIIVPCGTLHTLPFAALPLAGRPLTTLATLLITPSLHLLTRLIARPASKNDKVLSIGVREYRMQESLPAAYEEANLIAAMHSNSDIWCDDQATIKRLQDVNEMGHLASYRLIHLAAHAWSDINHGYQAGIALADGELLLADLAQLHLDADLVVLSACESGVSQTHPNEEIVGLTYALLQAGTRAILSSLWEVADATSLDIMRMFYAARQEGILGPWSLAAMQRQAWNKGQAPYLWAAYTWTGKPSG